MIWRVLAECREFWRFFRAANRPWRRLVFYSEHAIYYRYFEGYVEALRARGAPISYITSDPRDPLLRNAPKDIRVWYFRALLPFVILWLDGGVLVMTMTDLHRFHVRRSARGAHHLYVFHAMMSTHMVYRQGAFDYYDTIFCVGPHHVEELTRARARNGRPTAQLVAVGYPWVEKLSRDHRGHRAAVAGSPLALIAPSWGEGNILDSCADALVEALRFGGYRVVVRPHPEYAKRHPQRLLALQQRLEASGQATVECAWLSDRSLHEAELLVTDWSGIALEYAFGTERPVLYIDTPRKVHNADYAALGLTPLEVEAREQFGVVVAPTDLRRLGEAIARLTAQRAVFQRQIVAWRERCLFHFGRAAQVGADAIEVIMRGQRLAAQHPVITEAVSADETSLTTAGAIATAPGVRG